MNMNEQKVFHICIQPKNHEVASDVEINDFHIIAESPVMALIKVMYLPNINYMYIEDRDDIIIKFEGYAY